MPDATLELGGSRLTGWTGVEVTSALDALAPSFRLSMSERAPGERVPRVVRSGQRAVVALDGETVLAGHVDEVAPSYDADSHAIDVRGRDATGDLVDCSAPVGPVEWADTGLADIAAALCRPFGVPVSGNGGAPFRRFSLEPGETVFETIERGARMRSLLPRADGRGGLVLGGTDWPRAAVRLERGVNILRARGASTWTRRYGTYRVLGQQPANEFIDAPVAAHVAGEASDPAVRRHRPLALLAEQGLSDAEAQARAQWEAAVRAARSWRVQIMVRGWRERGDAGALWRPGRLVHVADDWLGLDGAMLITSVTWRRGVQGATSALMLAPEAAYRAEPLPDLDGEAPLWT